ncbi:MAG: carboxymuconolactone decarboxylase family protein [Bdellovibrionota bacterium]
MTLRSLVALATLTFTLQVYAATPVNSDQASTNGAGTAAVTQSFAEAQKMLGTVPSMLRQIPEAAVPGAWAELRDFQMGKTTLSNKTKELIGLAVAAQIPCRYCLYFHSKVGTELNGATDADNEAAIAISALTRKWSTFLNGLGQDPKAFQRDLDRMTKTLMRQTQANASRGTESGATSSAATSSSTAEVPRPTVVSSADEVYREAKKMWGFVPEFIAKYPKQGITGAWNEYNGIMFDPASKLTMKDRSLISLAVASQIPCAYCVTMDKTELRSHGATEAEINEAIAMAAATRHWSTVLNGSMMDERAFRSEVDGIVTYVKNSNKGTASGTTSGTTQPPEESSSSSGSDY